jgi:pyruvate dehydrogenase E2 component (dihydrolipoamide acetyltransferase)
MPKTGMTQETGVIVQWLHQEGEHVEKGAPLLEVMTDKVNMEVESPATGVLRNIKAFANDEVPVTQVIAYIAEPDEEIVEEKPAAAPAEAPVAAPPPTEEAMPSAEVSAEALAEPEGRRVRATPVAKRLARERHLDLPTIKGTGPGGAITKADVLRAAEAAAEEPPVVARPARAVPVAAAPTGLTETKAIPLVGRQKIIAQRMQQSFQEAPHIALTIEVDMTQAAQARGDVSYTALLVQVVARALREHPLVNSTLRGDQIVQLYDINIGVAVAAEEGLIVPVIKRADGKSLRDIDAELKDLAERARSGTLTLNDVSGGTFTITNLGMFGIPQFRAIINPPEAAILAVGSIVKRAVVINDGIQIRPMMNVTASADHRILDGVAVARFLQRVKQLIESAQDQS